MKILVTDDRIMDIPIGLIEDSTSGDFSVQVDMVSHFVAEEDGKYLSREDAREFARSIPFRELLNIFEQIKDAMEEIAVPKVNK